MTTQIVFIDYENVQNVELSSIPENDIEIKIFVGESQNKIPLELVRSAQRLGNIVEWVQIEGTGPNALDFHIAFYLGKLSSTKSDKCFVILSKDKGFDPLIRHVSTQKIKCRRINSILEISKKQELLSLNDDYMAKIIDNLSKIAKNKRPRTRKTLQQHINSLFRKKMTDQEILTVVDSLFVQKKISEENNKIKYHF